MKNDGQRRMVFSASMAAMVWTSLWSGEIRSFDSDGTSRVSMDSAKAVEMGKGANESERQRAAENRAELKRLRIEDSTEWDLIKHIATPPDTAATEEKERMQRKISGLIGLCGEERFVQIAEVDSLKDLTAEEKAFCKARLKLLNPLMP